MKIWIGGIVSKRKRKSSENNREYLTYHFLQLKNFWQVIWNKYTPFCHFLLTQPFWRVWWRKDRNFLEVMMVATKVATNVHQTKIQKHKGVGSGRARHLDEFLLKGYRTVKDIQSFKDTKNLPCFNWVHLVNLRNKHPHDIPSVLKVLSSLARIHKKRLSKPVIDWVKEQEQKHLEAKQLLEFLTNKKS